MHPQLGVRLVAGGLSAPTTMAFIGSNDILVLEKDTGRVQRVLNGALHSTVLDLSANSSGERGSLGIVLHPQFPANPGVYLFWTCRSSAPPVDQFSPDERNCLDGNMTGPDTFDVLSTPLLGNRVDRFVWNGTSLNYERNLIMLRSFQNDGAPAPPGQGDEGQPPASNHNGGIIAFGPDGKLYIIIGDVGRRGQLQNLPSGPTETGLGATVPDDQFGGPEPDDAHLTSAILRLNDDGSTPGDNPFFSHGAGIGGEAGRNIQKIFAYGFRNSFGMAFDPFTGNLWASENGESSFDELNLVDPGFNSGWIQVMGPIQRFSDYKQIDTGFQQPRWPASRLAGTPSEALSRLFVMPGSRFSNPEFSWKHVVPPAAVGFVASRALGLGFIGDMFVGSAVPFPSGGPLFRFQLTSTRRRFAFNDARLADRVADNVGRNDLTESESLVIGTDFGTVTDIRTGPNGNLYVVSLTRGAIYEIFRQ